MIDVFVRALAQLGDPRLRRVLWLSLGLSVLICLVLAASSGAILALVQFVSLGWLEATIDFLGGIFTVVLILLLFPAFVGMVAGFYMETVASAVEARHYPGLPPARHQPVWEAVWVGVRFGLYLIVLNLLALPLYLVPGLGMIVYYVLNGFILGREYFEFAAMRRLPAGAAGTVRKAHGIRVFIAGMGLALVASLPVVNLLLPIVGTAVMVHVFTRLESSAGP